MGVVFLRAVVLDDVTPVALGFVGRAPVDLVSCSVLLAGNLQKKKKK